MFSRFQMSERGKGKCLKNCDDNSGPLPRFIQAKNRPTIALIQSTMTMYP